MRYRRSRIWLLLAMFVTLGISGCEMPGHRSAQILAQECQPVVDSVIEAFNAGNYDSLAAHAGGKAGELATLENFHKAREKLGTCTEVGWASASESDGRIRVVYRARFARMPERVSFVVVFTRQGSQLVVTDVAPN